MIHPLRSCGTVVIEPEHRNWFKANCRSRFTFAFEKEVVCDVHGVRSDFFKEGKAQRVQASRNISSSAALGGSYFVLIAIFLSSLVFVGRCTYPWVAVNTK